MQKIDLLINSRWVIPIIPENIVLENYTVAVHQGRIVDLLPTNQVHLKYPSHQIHECPHHVLMPGLINAHTHTPMNLFRGLADDLTLMDWLQHHIWPAEADLIEENSVRIGSSLAIAEMLRTGTTCFNDNYMFPQFTADIVKETGIRACLGLQMMDVPTKWAPDGASALKKGLDIYKHFEKHPRITWAWAPHAPYTTTNETFKKLLEINKELQLPIHIHLHESMQEINDSIKQYHQRPIERLQQLDVLSPKLIAVHMVQINNNDIKIMQDHEIHVVHCPESNLKLASGFAPISNILNAKINVAIGTDGAASNNDLNMFGEMQTAALIAKAQAQDPTGIPAHQALQMATINGAKALGLDKEIGSLEIGKAADMITINFNHYFTQPMYHPISHLVYAMNALQVEDVWVDGQLLLSKGELVHLDTSTLIEDAKYWVDKAKKYGTNL